MINIENLAHLGRVKLLIPDTSQSPIDIVASVKSVLGADRVDVQSIGKTKIPAVGEKNCSIGIVLLPKKADDWKQIIETVKGMLALDQILAIVEQSDHAHIDRLVEC